MIMPELKSLFLKNYNHHVDHVEILVKSKPESKEEQKNERVLFLAGASKPLETFFSYYMESDAKQKVKQFLRKLRLYSRNFWEK